jgi:hypothetical protein
VAVASSPTGPGRLSRVRGCLLLAVCGDALGARFVGITRVDPADVDHQLATRTGSLRWTDDTAMTLVLAEHLVRRDGAVDEAELAGGFAADRHHDRCPVRCPCAVPLCGAGAVTGTCPIRAASGWKPPIGSPPWRRRWRGCRAHRAWLTDPVPSGRVPWPDPDRTRADQPANRRRVWCHGRPRADADW